MIASILYNTPELVKPLREQYSDIFLIDGASRPHLKESHWRTLENKFWTGNWDGMLKFFHSIGIKYIWMVNSDISKGVDVGYYETAKRFMAEADLFMLTPSFNSPHEVFNKKNILGADTKWIDMCCPIIDVEKYIELGGFDLQFKGYFADIDLCKRARDKGFKMAIDYSHYCEHIGGYTVNKEAKHEQSNMADAEVLCQKWGVKHYTELI
jgi:hypothetical protein